MALDYYTDSELPCRLLTHPTEVTLEEDIKKAVDMFKNPFAETLIWIKGELLDI